MENGLAMLERQRDKYQTLADSLPKDSAAWIAATRTAMATQDAIDMHKRLATQQEGG